MTFDEFIAQAIDPALQLLIEVGMPARIDSPEARAQMLAIAKQESNLVHRRQMGNGPARSFWQGERGGGMVHGVRTHPATRKAAAAVYAARGVAADDMAIWTAIEHDDVLAGALARLLMWSEPTALPKLGDVDTAWAQYLRAWRPGAYARGTADQRANLRAKWGTNYTLACATVAS